MEDFLTLAYQNPALPNNPQFAETVLTENLNPEDSSTVNIVRNAVRITSENRVHLQMAKGTKGSGEATALIPLTADSKEFFIPSFNEIPEGHSTFVIVSPYKDTCVEAQYVNGTDIRRIFFLALGEFEVFQSYSDNEDYTGVFVNATRPVSVLGGHECAQVPTTAQFCDHLLEVAIPILEWGRDFIAGPILGRSILTVGYILRIVSSHTVTTISVDIRGIRTESHERNRGDFVTIDVPNNNDITTVRCSHPCMVLQYNKGTRAGGQNDVDTDPFMVTITPNDHFMNNMVFSTQELLSVSEEILPYNSYITIVAPDSVASGIILTNTNTGTVVGISGWVTGVMGGYSVASAGRLEHGNYTLYHPDPNAKLVGYVYGHGYGGARTGYSFATGYQRKSRLGSIDGSYLVVWGSLHNLTQANYLITN